MFSWDSLSWISKDIDLRLLSNFLENTYVGDNVKIVVIGQSWDPKGTWNIKVYELCHSILSNKGNGFMGKSLKNAHFVIVKF